MERKTRGLSPLFSYFKQLHAERERHRLEALKRGEKAIYGYYKNVYVPHVWINDPLNDVPPADILNSYKLEITCKQANELIKDGATSINMIIKHNGKWSLTYANALKLPANHFIRDINGRWCLFRKGKFYKII
jgi:hypothetical protein